MGVHGLWELLAPVGRRVSVETLAGKRLAVDASIWMIQFMKAMRDEKGDMVRNAHLIGFFRRICKLLYLRTKPVFIFDGGTPALKRRTVIARRRQRENAQAKIRKTAEKLLLNRLKDMRIKEQVENQRRQQKSDGKGKKFVSDDEPVQIELRDSASKGDLESSGSQQEKLDEMLAASIEAEKYGSLASRVDEVEKTVVKNDPKGKRILLDGSDLTDKIQSDPEKDKTIPTKDYQEKLDEMLAASIAAEDGDLSNNASTSTAAIPLEEESSDEDEQMLLPAIHGNVDPHVLASLPPSVQLELLVQMRERLMAENRQKYQKVKKAPEKFSEMQIQAYLKTVAFRREIDEVQKAAAGRGVGGVQTSRIASETNREFIFSSSFIGDKEVLASARAEGNGKTQENTSKSSFAGSVKHAASLNKSDATVELDMDEPRNPDEDIEVFIDERGRLRIRNRHMGIQMTRDIQRNLDLMKEKERKKFSSVSNNDEMDSTWENFPHEDQFLETLPVEKVESVISSDRDKDFKFQNGSSLEISFEDNGNGGGFDEDDDDIFVRLAAGEPMTISSTGNNPKEEASPCTSDSDWEEMPVERKSGVSELHANFSNSKEESSPSASDSDWEEMPVEQKSSISEVDTLSNKQNIHQEANNMGESEAEGEQTACRDPNSTEDNLMKRFSKGYLEEEADLQEAIKRSLLEINSKKSDSVSCERDVGKCGAIRDEKNHKAGIDLVISEVTQHNLPFGEAVDGAEVKGTLDGITAPKASGSLIEQSNTSLVHNADGQKGITKLTDAHSASCSEIIGHDGSKERKLNKKTSQAKSVNPPEKLLDVSIASDEPSIMTKGVTKDSSQSHSLGGVPLQSLDMAITDEKKNGSLDKVSANDSANKDNVEGESSIMLENERDYVERESCSLMTDTREPSTAAPEAHIPRSSHDMDLKQKSRDEKTSSENAHILDSPTNADESGVRDEFSEANFEEEMMILGQEFMSLGDEQRRLERNAESVSSEMFVECQELLQMFGLPYIIAPMEAEAQCAFMELANHVDGIITDDSDAFLFGARSVYKNIFDDRKYVETYFVKDIEKELGLTREKLIRMALLLGSDYTEGISGIGIVNAIEVVNAFPEEDGLQKFREWVESPDPTILGKTNTKTSSNTKKRGFMSVDSDGASIDDTQEIKQIFMDKHRNVSKNWHIPSTFPSDVVIAAYSSPQVDRSTETFSWGKPDLLVLRKLCWEKFGWNSHKTDDLLLPVLKEYDKRETQLRMEAFYSFNERFAKIRSKRIKKAVKGITKNQSSEVADDTLQEVSGSRKKKRVAPPGSGDNSSDKTEKEEANLRNPLEKSPVRKMRQNRKQERRNSTRSLQGNRGGTGRGRTQKRGRGKGQKHRVSELSESSSDIDDSAIDLHERHEAGYLQRVRRSTRSRNPVKYNANEDDEFDESPGNEECPGEKSEEEFLRDEKRVADAPVECGGGKHNEDTADKLIKDCPSENQLQIGRGFCADEAEIGKPSTIRSEEPYLENESVGDYLMMGGGFCVDEDEKIGDQGDADAPADFMEESLARGSHSMDGSKSKRLQSAPQQDSLDSVPTHDRQTNESEDKCASEDPSMKDNGEINAENSSAAGLSAMPFLKRKRRRR